MTRRFTAFLGLIGLVLIAGGCATSEEWKTWAEHPAHFASGHHIAFSLRNQAPPPRVDIGEPEQAKAGAWWGGAVQAGPVPIVAGQWAGTWSGSGLMGGTRGGAVQAQLTQAATTGAGRLIVHDSMAAEGVPVSLREAGSWGVPVALSARPGSVVLTHAGGHGFILVLVPEGELLVGEFREGSRTVSVTLFPRR